MRVIVARIQAQPLHATSSQMSLVSDLSGGRQALQGAFRQLHVVSVGPLQYQAHRDALRLRYEAALDAVFAAVRGVGADFSPAQRRFMQRTVEGHSVEIQAYQVFVVLQGHIPELGEDPGLHPFLKPGVGRGVGVDAYGAQCFPLAARAQHKENAVEHLPFGHPPLVAAQGVDLRDVDGQLGR